MIGIPFSGCVAKRPSMEGFPPAVASARCLWSPAAEDSLIVAGNLIMPGGEVREAALYAEHGKIREISTRADLVKAFPGASVMSCTNALISPGLINAHEHTNYSFTGAPVDLDPVYVHRDEWRLGLNGKRKIEPPSSSDPRILAWVELRHLLSGVTTIAGSGAVMGITKNASRQGTPEYEYQIDAATFPFGTSAMEEFLKFPCNSPPRSLPEPQLTAGVPPGVAYVPHVGEGVGCASELEISSFLHFAERNSGRPYSLIHGVGLKPEHVDVLERLSVVLVWSPRSNLSLYGTTTNPANLLDRGIPLALGTDWSPSGSYDIWEEMDCGQRFMAQAGLREMTGLELWKMTTSNAAKAIGIDSRTGAIHVGLDADFMIMDGLSTSDLASFGKQTASNVLATIVAGRVQAVDARKVHGRQVGTTCPNSLAGKRICIDFESMGFTFQEMLQRNEASVPIGSSAGQAPCEFKGWPPAPQGAAATAN